MLLGIRCRNGRVAMCIWQQRVTFRLVYVKLAARLRMFDDHMQQLLSAYERAADKRRANSSSRFHELAEVLAESKPYEENRSADAEPIFHQELVRIEQAWAARLEPLRAAARRMNELALADCWATALGECWAADDRRRATRDVGKLGDDDGRYRQYFPFPTAVMLTRAIESGALDRGCWRLIRDLNKLTDPSFAINRMARWSRPHLESECSEALKLQKEALRGGGFVAKEDLFRHVRFRTRERKLPQMVPDGHANGSSCTPRSSTRTRGWFKKSGSMMDADALPLGEATYSGLKPGLSHRNQYSIDRPPRPTQRSLSQRRQSQRRRKLLAASKKAEPPTPTRLPAPDADALARLEAQLAAAQALMTEYARSRPRSVELEAVDRGGAQPGDVVQKL